MGMATPWSTWFSWPGCTRKINQTGENFLLILVFAEVFHQFCSISNEKWFSPWNLSKMLTTKENPLAMFSGFWKIFHIYLNIYIFIFIFVCKCHSLTGELVSLKSTWDFQIKISKLGIHLFFSCSLFGYIHFPWKSKFFNLSTTFGSLLWNFSFCI